MLSPLLSLPSRRMASQRFITTTKTHILALDGIVNVNSLFTVALFLGITTSDPKPATFVPPSSACAASATVAENLVAFHVYSFSCFLFSSLVAFALKQAIKITNCGGMGMVHVNSAALRTGIVVSAGGSVLGCGFLTMALVDLVQIKLGILGCRGWYTISAVSPLVVLVPTALVIYISLVIYSFAR